jgi:hypothetical protein
MFTLRGEQMDAFRESMMRRFEKRAAEQLRSRFAAKLADTNDQELEELVRSGVVKARAYGVVGETDVSRYLEYMVEYGRDFDTSPDTAWAQPILTAPTTTGTEKMKRLGDFTTFELRP